MTSFALEPFSISCDSDRCHTPLPKSKIKKIEMKTKRK